MSKYQVSVELDGGDTVQHTFTGMSKALTYLRTSERHPSFEDGHITIMHRGKVTVLNMGAIGAFYQWRKQG